MNLKAIFAAITLCTVLTGCDDLNDSGIIPPTADNVLTALRQKDQRIIQVKLECCQRSNPHEGEELAHPFLDYYQCDVMVERYDPVFEQNFIKKERPTLNYSSGKDWTTDLY